MSTTGSTPDLIPHKLGSLQLTLPIPMFLHELCEHLLGPLDALTPVHLPANLPLAVLPRRHLRVVAVHCQLTYKLSSRPVTIPRYYEVNHVVIIVLFMKYLDLAWCL